jgi:hypothetical protein
MSDTQQTNHPILAKSKMTFGKTAAWLLIINTFVIGLGELSEAIELISNAVDYTESRFSNSLEYGQLEKVNVGNTVEYIEDVFGRPQVSRSIDDTTTANYFHNRKFLLTLFYQDDRVVAYTYVPLIDDFEPTVITGSDLALGDFSYHDFSSVNNRYVVDHSTAVSFYLELVESGRSNLFTHSYIGHLNYGTGEPTPLLEELYEQHVFGEADQTQVLQQNFRKDAKPNLYGEGMLPLSSIENSVLTTTEFRRYFH